jgi:hypothetical protein
MRSVTPPQDNPDQPVDGFGLRRLFLSIVRPVQIRSPIV